MQKRAKRPPLYPNGTIIRNYELIKRIGHGGFGDIYLVKNLTNHLNYAMKMEVRDTKNKYLSREIRVLKRLKSTCFPRIWEAGTHESVKYCVMSLLGPSLSQLKRSIPSNRFSPATAMEIITESLTLIERLHSMGYVHRDIKPSNFLIRPKLNSPLCLIDFGLAASFMNPVTKQHLPKIGHRFIGTQKYASPNAHKQVLLSRRDDLYSWFYMALELLGTTLPWAGLESDEMCEYKKSVPSQELCREVPACFARIYDYIRSLKYATKPDYEKIQDILMPVLAENRSMFPDNQWSMLWQYAEEERSLIPDEHGQWDEGDQLSEDSLESIDLKHALIPDGFKDPECCCLLL